MLKALPYRWGLLVFGLVFAGALAAAAAVIMKRDHQPWQVDAVEVSGRSAGGVRLELAGEGLPDGLRAMLVPEADFGGSAGNLPDLSVSLYQFATDGRLAVASTRDQRLLILDVSGSHSPKVLGGMKFTFPGNESGISSLALVGSRVVVGKGNGGVALVDLSDPQTPRLTDSLKVKMRLLDVQASGDVAYFASDTLGLVVITFAGDRLASRQVPGSPPALRVAMDQRRLVTASRKGQLACYQLDAQGWPTLVGTVKVEEEIRDLVVTSEALYVCTSAGRLMAFTLNTWPRPQLAGKLSLKGSPLKLEWLPATHNLVCTLLGSGLAVIDISRVDAPRLTGTLPLVKVPIAVKTNGDRVFLAGVSGLKILSSGELIDRFPPQEIDHSFSLEAGDPMLSLWNSAAFASNRRELKQLSSGTAEELRKTPVGDGKAPLLFLPDDHGVRLHALSGGMPTAEVVGRLPVSDPERDKYGTKEDLVSKVFWRNGRAFVLAPSKVFIFEVDPSGRVLSAEEFRPTGKPESMVWLSPGYLILALRDQGLQVVDVGKPGAARVVGEYPLPRHQRKVGSVQDLVVEGSRLYVTRARLGVEVYDLADPASPRLLQRIDTPGFADRLTLNDGLLLVADQDQGIFVIDVSGQYAVAVGSYRLPTRVREVLYDGTSLFMTNASGGIVRLPPPLRLARMEKVSSQRASLTVPAGVVAGRYRLALYDDKTVLNLPVRLQ